MPSGFSIARIAGGVLGGWLAIMAPAVVTIALRLRDFDASGLPSFYALTLTLGWLTLLVSLILMGRLSDRLQSRFGSRVLLARLGVPGLALSGVVLAVAPTPQLLLAAWLCVQLPAAAVIATALAESGDHIPLGSRGVASGLVGAASIFALLLGTTLVRVTGESREWGFILPALLGALLALPLLADGPSGGARMAEERLVRQPSVLLIGWPLFLLASLLLSWSTSTTNGFVVTYVQYVALIPGNQIALTATAAVIVATGLAVVSSILSGWLSHGGQRSPRIWVGGAITCAIALALILAFPSGAMFYVAAALFGIGFGSANGVELSVVLSLRGTQGHLGRDLGLFTAATTAPYVLVPALASVLLAGSPAGGVLALFAMASVAAFIGAVLTLRLVQRSRTA